jgi:hypothetical protein
MSEIISYYFNIYLIIKINYIKNDMLIKEDNSSYYLLYDKYNANYASETCCKGIGC